MSKGFLYIATGDKYLEEAKVSVTSLKAITSDVSIALVTDSAKADIVFDVVIPIPIDAGSSWKDHLIYKIRGIQSMPFIKNVFVDSDTYFCEDCTELFELLNHFDLLICQDFWEASDIQLQGKTVPAYHAFNTGMIAFNKNSKTSLLFDSWLDIYTANKEQLRHDQPAFMQALLQSEVRFFVLPSIYNFRFVQSLAIHVNETVKILHGRCSNLEEFEVIKKKVNVTTQQRVWDATKQKCHYWTKVPFHKRCANQLYKILPDWIKHKYRNRS